MTLDMSAVEVRLWAKADRIRHALIVDGIVVTPNPDVTLGDLSPDRQMKWLKLADLYIQLFC